MTTPTNKTDLHSRLREEAESRLKSGTTELVGRYSLSLDALNLLHRLSSNPETAGDALKLLHELQVHQVELDLQNEEIRNAEQAIAEDLSYYRELYETAPAAYFLVNFQGDLIKANQAAADLFGVPLNQLAGDCMERFLTPESHPAFRTLLDRLEQGDSVHTCEISSTEAGNSSRPLLMSAKISHDKACALLICHELP